jgi:hypothetical protein
MRQKWHRKHRLKGRIPSGLRNVDTESAWFKSGCRGRVQGYRLVLQGLASPQPVPLRAAWRPNSAGEATTTARALAQARLAVTDVLLGDTAFGGAALTRACAEAGGWC